MHKVIFFMLFFFFISGTVVGGFSSVSASDLVEDSWNTKASMKQARDKFGVVASDGLIYVI